MTETKTIRVLLVDDHQMVRQGLVFFLSTQPGIEIVGQAEDGLDAVQMASELVPDVILMDLVMPEMDGLEATHQIKARQPDIAVLALTSFVDDNRVVKAIQAGASGYLMKDVKPAELARAIQAAARGEVYLQSQAASKLAEGLHSEADNRDEANPQVMTEREYEVLCLVTRGLSNREIANELSISLKTVKVHVSNILRKLDLESRVQAALYALRHKIVCLEET